MKMNDPYELETKPTFEWIDDNCFLTEENKYEFKNEKFYDKWIRPNNKCKMLNNE